MSTSDGGSHEDLARPEDLLRTGRWEEAAEAFTRVYDAMPSAYAASRLIHCLRKQGIVPARQAVSIGKTARKQWPENKYLIAEYAWAIYDGYLREDDQQEREQFDEEEQDADQARLGSPSDIQIRAARRMLEVSSEPLVRWCAVRAICTRAKARQQREIVDEFCSLLDPNDLEATPKQLNGHDMPIPRLLWYQWACRAKLQLEEHERCLELAERGLGTFPNDQHLHRRHALALSALGRQGAALKELQEVELRHPGQWYIGRDIARTYVVLESFEEAWRWYCEAALAPGDGDARVGMYDEMADVLAHLKRVRDAFDHRLLAWAICAGKPDWDKRAAKSRDALIRLRSEHANQLTDADTPPTAPPPDSLYRKLKRLWQEAVAERMPCGTGKIGRLSPDGFFGFIAQPDGSSVHFLTREFRGRGRRPEVGMTVQFQLKRSFDKKKNCESTTAVNVVPASEHAG